MGRLLDSIEEKRAVLLAAKEGAERTRKDARKVSFGFVCGRRHRIVVAVGVVVGSVFAELVFEFSFFSGPFSSF